MYKFEERHVAISELKQCPVKVTLQTDALLVGLEGAARVRPESIEPITVAVLGGVKYIVNGHLRVQALFSTGHDMARAHVTQVKEISDVVRMHIELNTHGTVNPLGMLDAVEFLKENGAGHDVSKRYLALSQRVLHAKVRNMLDEFLADACKKYASVELPLYIVEWIVGFEAEKEQLVATTVILDSLKRLREYKFAFPAPAELDVISHSLKLGGQEEKEVMVYAPSKGGSKWPKVGKKEAADLIRGSPHDSIVRCMCGKKLLLNTKTRRVSSVRDDRANRCIKLEEEESAKPVYAIPYVMLDFLEVGSAELVRFTRIRSKKDLVKFASGMREDAQLRLVILSR